MRRCPHLVKASAETLLGVASRKVRCVRNAGCSCFRGRPGRACGGSSGTVWIRKATHRRALPQCTEPCVHNTWRRGRGEPPGVPHALSGRRRKEDRRALEPDKTRGDDARLNTTVMPAKAGIQYSRASAVQIAGALEY